MGDHALVSVDLDDSWAYLRTHGDPEWAAAPSTLTVASQRLFGLFDDLGIKVTVFVLGHDASTAEGAELIQRWHQSGHEIANHSFEHRHDLAAAPLSEIEGDIARSEQAIAEIIGDAPVGFRCPSFGLSDALHGVLKDRGYAYDASLLPTMIGPLLRWYHRRSMDETSGSSTNSPDIFGPMSDGRLPLGSFEWVHENFRLLEVPVTTMPIVRSPVHMSYIHTAAAVSPTLGRAYLKSCSGLCRVFGIPISFLIHPPDVLDATDAPQLSYLPGMRASWQDKLDLVRTSLLTVLNGRVPLRHIEHVRSITHPEDLEWARANRSQIQPAVTG